MFRGIADELAGIHLGDERLNQRSRKVIEALSANPEASINAAVNGWGDTQAAYRFFNNANVSPEQILEPHRPATLQRIQEYPVVLVAQETTELDDSDHPTHPQFAARRFPVPSDGWRRAGNTPSDESSGTAEFQECFRRRACRVAPASVRLTPNYGFRFTDGDVDTFAKLKLRRFYSDDAGIDDAMVARLANIHSLEELSLHKSPITDQGLLELKRLKNLTRLDLTMTKVTAAGVADLQQALPNCKIEWDLPKE